MAAPSWWVSSRSTGGGRERWARTCTPLASASMRYGRGVHRAGAPPSLPPWLVSAPATKANPRGRPGDGTPGRELGQGKAKPWAGPVLRDSCREVPAIGLGHQETPFPCSQLPASPALSNGLRVPSHFPQAWHSGWPPISEEQNRCKMRAEYTGPCQEPL